MTRNVGGNFFAALAFFFFDDAEFFWPLKIFFVRAKISKKNGLGCRDRFRPKIVKIGAILAIFEPFEVLEFVRP